MISLLQGDVSSSGIISQNIKSVYSPLYSNSLGELDSFVTYDLAVDPCETPSQDADSMYIEKILFYWASLQIGFPEALLQEEEMLDVLRKLFT